MTTTSPANSTRKFNKRLKTTTSRSAFAPPANCDDRELDHMKLIRSEEIFKEVSIGANGALNEKMGLRYKECRKNHAASIGGYAVDGCREFMPAGEEGTAAAFKCAACSCHRNFHRKELESNDCCCDCSSISATTK